MRPLLQKRGESGDLKEKSTAGYYHLESLTPETQAQPLLLRGPARAIEETLPLGPWSCPGPSNAQAGEQPQ